MNHLEQAYLRGRQLALTKYSSEGFDPKAALLAGIVLRGVGGGVSSLGYNAALRDYGKRLAAKGYDPKDLPGKEGGSWLSPSMYGGIGGGVLGGTLGSFVSPKSIDNYVLGGMALGGGLGAYTTYARPSRAAEALLSRQVTPDAELVKIKTEVKKKLKAKEKEDGGDSDDIV